MMVKPKAFGANTQTAATNSFQQAESNFLQHANEVNDKANNEFDNLVELLIGSGVRVIVDTEPEGCSSPDAVFPNNWVSFHHNQSVIIYPMMAANRRSEIKETWLNAGESHQGVQVESIMDLRTMAEGDVYLEGTGSIVFDHEQRKMYGCRSPRTNPSIFKILAEQLHYTPMLFGAMDQHGQPIYHTNVMMSIGKTFAVVCFNSVTDTEEQAMLRKELVSKGRTIIEIDITQMINFCGNVLQLMNKEGNLVTVISNSAYNRFTAKQITMLGTQSKIVTCDIPTIEQHGGGSVRCMLAEVFCTVK